ncbi:hypothetical protein A1507_14110 [Methylomonas koyamae]|uniref:Uncharacterized protein n=1 Tax=Methylomonas koyamae TaxID=702114 RepID=A0A177NCC9_9GAMM|nr:hypothetical protein [Methylomonas koyamae]OAI15555.1 hypothetical protein A1507_14110 [Methylomonas koyamae]
MKSIKKRSKRLLAEIEAAAGRLVALSADLGLFQGLCETAGQIGACAVALAEQVSAADKSEAALVLVQSPELARLADFADLDAISLLEERMFAAQADLEQGEVGRFLQQVLEKSEKLYAALLQSIQQLLELAEEAEQS